jgi:membrane protease YdiL (CAAX protease family)
VESIEPQPADAPGLGDDSPDGSPGARRAVLRELVLLWLGTLLLIRGVVALQSGAGLPEWVLAAVPCLFIYAPVALCRWREVDSYAYRLSIPAFRDLRAWGAALKDAGLLFAIILVPWLVGYHLYQTQIFGYAPTGRLPGEPWTLIAYQIFFVAIPEESFYRGYMQTRLNEVFARRFSLLGVRFGHSLWITAILFAFGHSIVVLRWWHFAIFFPGLLFGLLRERSGGVLAGAFFHAFCNIAVVTLDTAYGVIPP